MSKEISVVANRTSVKFYALVLGTVLALTPVQALATSHDNDLDGDSVNDKIDNCVGVENFRVHGVQPDTDGDGYGNSCDCDYNNNGTVDIEDVGLFSQFFGAADPEIYGDVGTSEIAWGEERYIELGGQEIVLTPELADHDANGRVDLYDFNALHADFGQEPGPSNDL